LNLEQAFLSEHRTVTNMKTCPCASLMPWLGAVNTTIADKGKYQVTHRAAKEIHRLLFQSNSYQTHQPDQRQKKSYTHNQRL